MVKIYVSTIKNATIVTKNHVKYAQLLISRGVYVKKSS